MTTSAPMRAVARSYKDMRSAIFHLWPCPNLNNYVYCDGTPCKSADAERMHKHNLNRLWAHLNRHNPYGHIPDFDFQLTLPLAHNRIRRCKEAEKKRAGHIMHLRHCILHDWMDRADIGDWSFLCRPEGAPIYKFLPDTRSVEKIQPGLLPWPIELLVSRFSSKHLFSNGLPPSRHTFVDALASFRQRKRIAWASGRVS